MKMLILTHEKLYLKRTIELVLILFFSILGTTYTYGQVQDKITIEGVAKDSSGETLPEVLIYEKNNPKNEVYSDLDGNYSIQANSNSTLVFEFVGLETQEIKVNGQTNVNAVLKTAQANDLEEVVVVGFGTQTKANLTGAVSQIKVDEVSQPVSNPAQMLYGKAPGVNLVQNNGAPGSNSSITIRGAGIGNTQPLIVVDGLIVDSFDEIAPNDIETFTILKDAASASIYGSEAANGVILITTKRGSKGKLKININSSNGYSSPTTLPDMLSGVDYMKAMNERQVYGFNQQNPNSVYSQETMDAYQNGTLDRNYFGNTDWLDELFGTGYFTNQYLSVSGGSDNSRYLFSAQYNRQEGTLKENSFLDSYIVRTKLDFDPTKWLTIGTNITGTQRNSKSPRQSIEDIVRNGMQADPIRPIYYTNGDYTALGATGIDENGSPIFTDPSQSPMYSIQDGTRKSNQFKLNAQLYAKVKLIEGLSFEPTLYYKYNNTNIEQFAPLFTLYDGPELENIALERTESRLYRNASLRNDVQIDNIIRYSRKFNENHNLSAFVGHQYRQEHYEGDFQVQIDELPNNTLSALNTGNPSTVITNGGPDRDYNFQSFFGRIEYQLMNRYLFEANFRLDESSLFPTSDRQAFFPSFSLGWKLSEENFMRDIKNLNLLKLRASWGKLGNTNNLRSISVAPYIQTQNITDGYPWGTNVFTGIYETDLASTNVTWEETESYNIGIDTRLWDKLSFNIDWYRKKINDIIQLDNTPAIVGAGAPYINAGDVKNEGIEFGIDFSNRKNEFKYNIGFNANYNNNKITSLPSYPKGEYFSTQSSTLNIINRIGEPIGSYYGYVFDGIYQSQEEIDSDASAYNGAQPGWKRYKDLNSDGVINDDDRTIIGNSQPDWTYGINAGASYKGFDFTVTFNGVHGIDRLRPQNGFDPVQGNMTTDWLNRWSPENPSNELPVIGSERTYFSSWNIVDGSYLRLKVAELGYSLPNTLTSKWGIDRLRFYLSGTNLLTFTDFTDGFDPEKFGNNWRNETYPLNKTYVFGINLNF